MEQIAVHAQSEAGRFSTQSGHIRTKMEKGAVWLLERVSLIGDNVERWACDMLAARGIQGVRVLTGLLNPADRYDRRRCIFAGVGLVEMLRFRVVVHMK